MIGARDPNRAATLAEVRFAPGQQGRHGQELQARDDRRLPKDALEDRLSTKITP